MDRAPLTPGEFASAVTAITSAFGDPTRREIYLYARELDEGVTASEVANRFDLHPNVARHHLDKLAGGGYLEVGVASLPARAGRPSKRYRPSSRDRRLDLPEVRHDDLLIALLGKALSLLPADAAETMAEEVGIDYGRSVARSVGAGEAHRSFRAALAVVADALTAHGFAAHAERRGTELRIVSEHCPFGDAAIEHPVICAVDRGMVKGMLHGLYGEADAAIEASRPMGADVCVTAVRG
ncbi:MAG: helix-turn-helix transcriptional regulator [Acidimicrobiales bacterium]